MGTLLVGSVKGFNLNIRGGIQKFVDKLNIFFMHYRIFSKASHLKQSYLELPTSNKSYRLGCPYTSYSHHSNVHIQEVPDCKLFKQ